MTRTAISPRLAMRTFFSTLRLSLRPGDGPPGRPDWSRQHCHDPYGVLPCRAGGLTSTSGGSTRSTRPTATCSTRPAGAPPREWWRWPTTRRPAGAGWAGGGRRRPGPACSSRCCSARCSSPTGCTCATAVVALAAADACSQVAGVRPGPQVAQRPAGPGGRKLAGVLAEADPGRPRRAAGLGGRGGGHRASTSTGRARRRPAATVAQRGRRAARSTVTPCSAPCSTPSAPGGRDLDGPRRAGRGPPTSCAGRCTTLGRRCGWSWPGAAVAGTAVGPHRRGPPGGRDGRRPGRPVAAGDVVHVRPDQRAGAARAGPAR